MIFKKACHDIYAHALLIKIDYWWIHILFNCDIKVVGDNNGRKYCEV